MEIPIAILGIGLALTGTIVVWVRNRKFPRLSCLWIVAILVIFLCVGASFFVLTSHFDAGYTPNRISDTDVSGLTTEITWPISVVKDQSFDLEVLIIPTPSLTAGATASPTQRQVLSQLTPVGTPNVPISQAFGQRFDAFAIADLSASAFDISPQQQARQSLDQNEVVFDWTLTPKYIDQQTLRVSVTGIWIPKGGGETIERPLSGHLLNISVSPMMPVTQTTPFFVPGQLTFSDLLVALISSALNVPWIVELLKKRKETKKDQPDTSPSATAPVSDKTQQQPNIAPSGPSVTKPPPTTKQKKKKQPRP